MSGYRVIAGYGKLKRNNGEAASDLPTVTDTSGVTTVVAPSTIFGDLGTYLEDGGKWKRFGGGVDMELTIERNINFHNDIGIRTYTVATSGILEPSLSINGYVSAKYLGWMKYALNMDDKATIKTEETKDGVTTVTETYKYTHPIGPQMFDIGYVQSNSKTNDYAGSDEYHILTGCAIDTVTFSYELGTDAGVKFSIEILALMDWFSLGTLTEDINTYLEDTPKDVFSTGCIATSTDDSTYTAVAQTDSASLTISNFLERRGNCNVNYGSGYSMGTLNVEMDTSTYANNPKKYMLGVYGYDPNGSTLATYGIRKTPHQIPYMRFHTDDSDAVNASTLTKQLNIYMDDVIATSYTKTFNPESAILDSPKLRGKDVKFKVSYIKDTTTSTEETTTQAEETATSDEEELT